MTESPAVFIEQRLREIILPPLVRPPVPPEDDPTKELVFWGMRRYVYSLVAHIRTVLRGAKLLANSGNAPTFIIVCRHVYEWNMQSSYAYLNFDLHLKNADLKSAWNLYLSLSEGNSWIKKHGQKYAPEFENDELESSIRIRHFIKAYKKDRVDTYGSENVDDDYSYLSEHAHANGFCLQPYMELHPPEVKFIEAPPAYRLPGVFDACVMEWVMSMIRILGLTKESFVHRQLVEVLQRLIEETNNSGSVDPK